MAFSSNAAPSGTGADRSTSESQLAARRFTAASVSGTATIGGVFTGTTGAGSYQFFYPGSSFSSPTSFIECPIASLDCSITYPDQPASIDITFSAIKHDIPEFVVVDLVGADGSKEFVVLGTEFTGSVPTSGLYRYAIARDIFVGSDIPFARGDDTGFPFSGQPAELDIYWGAAAAVKPVLSKSINFDESAGRSTTSVLIGGVSVNGDGPFLVGHAFVDIDKTGPDVTPTFYLGPIASADTGNGKDFFGVLGPNHFVLNAVSDNDGYSSDGMNAVVGSGPTYHPVNTVSLTSVGAPGTRSTGIRSGFVGGSGMEAGSPQAFVTTTPPRGGQAMLLILDGSNTAQGHFAFSDAQGVDRYELSGGAGNDFPALSAYIDDDNFASMFTSGFDNGVEAAGTGYVVTGRGNNEAFDLCSTCEFLTWGVWSGAVGSTPGSTPQAALHMAGWVAGTAAEVATLTAAATKSASFNGNVYGTVADGSGLAVKTGSFNASVSFGASSYDVTSFTLGFDGQSYSAGSATGVANTDNFQISDSVSVAGRTMGATGYFFGSPATAGDPPPEIAGDFKITGSGYNAAGVFGGRR